jgi:hypothetical protein
MFGFATFIPAKPSPLSRDEGFFVASYRPRNFRPAIQPPILANAYKPRKKNKELDAAGRDICCDVGRSRRIIVCAAASVASFHKLQLLRRWPKISRVPTNLPKKWTWRDVLLLVALVVSIAVLWYVLRYR